MNRPRAIFLVLLLASAGPMLSGVRAAGPSSQPATQPVFSPPTVRPYIDPGQMNVPWPKHDHYKQPWRGFLETRSGYDFLQGIGIVFNQPDNIDLSCRLLAEAGFRTFRVEVPFGDMKWDESGFGPEDRFLAIFRRCKLLGIRPTILLNAHHGVPCPIQAKDRVVAEAAKAGERTIRLADVSGLRAGYSGLSNQGEFWAAQILFTDIDAATGTCKLSRPLPADLPANKAVPVTTLKYRPLFAVGTAEFEESIGGWLTYVETVLRTLKQAGVDQYDLEVWNELTFGSNWLDADRYYERPVSPPQIDALQPGGRCWELARRTLETAKLNGPRDVRVIWGFSNMTFYHTAINQLPAGMDGQSYHPYGTGTRELDYHEQHPHDPNLRQGPPPPPFKMRLPEGYAMTWVQTECLLRHTSPQGRKTTPRETPRFYQYMTEHGVYPPECDVKDPDAAVRLKTKSILRAFCMWLNKGLDVMHWYCAAGAGPLDFGILPPNLAQLKSDAKFDEVATPPMKAMRNLTRCFAGATPTAKTRHLGVEIEELSEPRKIFEGVSGYPPLWERECFAVLPFEVSPTKFVIPVYVMTYDVTKEHPGSRYRVTITNLPASVTSASYYDPVTDKAIEVTPTIADGVMTIELPVVDYPRVLTLEKR